MGVYKTTIIGNLFILAHVTSNCEFEFQLNKPCNMDSIEAKIASNGLNIPFKPNEYSLMTTNQLSQLLLS